MNLDKLSELPANLEKLINVKLEITKRTCLRAATHRQARGENENVYINRRIVLEDLSACDAQAGGGDEYDSAAQSAMPPIHFN